jgi:hypothetical protein
MPTAPCRLLVGQTLVVRQRCRAQTATGTLAWERLSGNCKELKALRALVRYPSVHHGTRAPAPATFLTQIKSRLPGSRELLDD